MITTELPYVRGELLRSTADDLVKLRKAWGEIARRRAAGEPVWNFTGLERFNIAMRFTKEDQATSKKTGYQGPVILCNIRETPISGHFSTSEVTNYLKDSDRILIWYAPLAAKGYFIPYRVLMTTSMGDLSLVLTRLRQ